MFDIGFFELLLIGIVGLLVLGPERLPRAARTVGLWMRRARATWYSVRNELERELAEADLKKSLQQEAGELDRLGQSIAALVGRHEALRKAHGGAMFERLGLIDPGLTVLLQPPPGPRGLCPRDDGERV